MTDRFAPTPGQTVGPFFHGGLLFERGDELVAASTPGAIRFHGTVYDGAGAPVPDALLEILQADGAGRVPVAEGSLCRLGDFAGWGRAATNSQGEYSFTTVEPCASFIAVIVFARGLLDRLFTRAYLPGAIDPFLDSLPTDRRQTLLAARDRDGDLRFDIRLQGPGETVFLAYPQQVGR
jgi:protocatechuate 3,4-dioxygenase alpha subunit